MGLRSRLVRLAHDMPSLREHLLPLLSKRSAVATSDSLTKKLSALMEWKNELISASNTLDVLIAAGEARRLGRVGDIKILSMSFSNGRIQGVIQGTQDKYQTRITINPTRGHRCTCPDWAHNGVKVGPCKHVLALAYQFKAEKVLPNMDLMENHVDLLLEKSGF